MITDIQQAESFGEAAYFAFESVRELQAEGERVPPEWAALPASIKLAWESTALSVIGLTSDGKLNSTPAHTKRALAGLRTAADLMELLG